ncbi:repressor of yield of DENV protein [Lingula anatina]|uniref:Repressor of yield of DENV protein n=1 Tax=Lingula anatina TaxID=7574 RepID=A0A1S3J9E0_LINAN|nr:repressor of yield of DENV protein [Lingula anatina]|eukprot:XP_013407020.1 repressor of yield of DENV protein [Lingula anatina]
MADVEEDAEKKLNAFRELFRGRFTENEAGYLVQKFDFDIRQAASYVFETTPEDLRREIQEEAASWIEVVPRTSEARNGRLSVEIRQFACQACDKAWWRRVPARKLVSKCYGCRVKFDAIPRDREWGYAEFHCNECGHDFRGWAQMGTASPCYHCGAMVTTTSILPPIRGGPGQRGGNRHSCSFCIAGGPCCHPQVRRRFGLPRVVYSSNVHVSSGSTVATFLPQDDLMNDNDFIAYDRLSPIPSDDGSDGGSDDANGGAL